MSVGTTGDDDFREVPLRQVAPTTLGRGIDLRLAPLAVGAWIGAGFGVGHEVFPLLGILAALLAGVAVLTLSLRLSRWNVGRPLAAALVLGAVGLALAASVGSLSRGQWERASSDISAYDGGPTAPGWLPGTVVSDPVAFARDWEGPGWRFKLRASGHVDIWVRVPAEVLQKVPLVRGTHVTVKGTFESLEPQRPPLWGFVTAKEIELQRRPSAWQLEVSELKSALDLLCSSRAGPAAALISGMAIGDDRGLEEGTSEAMRVTSLTHLTAVSGSHVAISLAVINALLPGRRLLRALSTWFFLGLVIVVVGPEPAVVRAVTMGGLAAWGLTMKRGGQPLTLLFVVTTVTVLVDPWSAVSLGFALSTVATAGILTVGRAGTTWARELIAGSVTPEWLRPVACAVAEAVVIAVVAQAATLPILALINPWLPTWGVVANLLVAPIVTPLTLLGLGAAITCLWWPGAAKVCVTLAAPFAKYMEATALRVAGWPLALFPWPQGWPGALLALALVVIGGMVVLYFAGRLMAKGS